MPKETPSKNLISKPKPTKSLKSAKSVAAPKAAASSKSTAASKKTPTPRDPSKTERNRIITKMTEELRTMLPQVLKETAWPSEASLNAVIGGKAAEFMDLHHEQILSADAYVTLYMKGFKAAMTQWSATTHCENYERLKMSKIAQKYFMLFLKRSYLKHFDEYSRKRPHLEVHAAIRRYHHCFRAP